MKVVFTAENNLLNDFLIDKINGEFEVLVYDSIEDLTSRVEWQDIFEGKSLIMDETGLIYNWDSSKNDEIGIVYDYTMVTSNKKSDLIDRCLAAYNQHNKPYEFTFR